MTVPKGQRASLQASRVESEGKGGERWFLARNRDPCGHLRAPDLSRFTWRAENWRRRSNDNVRRNPPRHCWHVLHARFYHLPIVHALESQIVVRIANYGKIPRTATF